MLFIVLLVILVIYIWKYKKDWIENLISKIKYAGEDSDNGNSMFFSQKLNNEFETNSFLYDTISNINQNGIDYIGIYPDRMEIDSKVINYKKIGMNELENIGECKALAYYIKSNLDNKNKYEINQISDLYTNEYDVYAVGYSVTDKDKKYNM